MSRARLSRRRWVLGLLASYIAFPLGAQETLVTFKSLAPDVAFEMAQAALEHCRAEGYQVAVAVVDRMGVTQVMLRDRYAGPHTPRTSERKAWTAISSVSARKLTAVQALRSDVRGV